MVGKTQAAAAYARERVAPRPPWTSRAGRAAQPARSGIPPRPEPTPTTRARQQPRREPPLDLRHVLAYRDHGASARLGWPSRRLLQKTTGRAHLLPDAAHRHVVVAHQRHDPPRDRVPATLTPNDAKPPAHRHQERRLTYK